MHFQPFHLRKKTRIEDYDTSDFIIDGYEHHEPVNMKMRI